MGIAVIATLSACASPDSATSRTASAGAERKGMNTGTFPNLNVPPKVAAEQITPEEKAARLAQLKAEKQQLTAEGATAKPTANTAELKKLAQSHAQDALKQIEGE
ncbi:hypothetical protein MesoLjLb_49580 [Mesorhizobium sp. L-8-3]|nr:hypothetical protein MesoLjLb_49580 [Mesorhizobium sp. L-8-3]